MLRREINSTLPKVILLVSGKDTVQTFSVPRVHVIID